MKAPLLTTALACLLLSGCVSIPQNIQGNNALLTSANYPVITQDVSRYSGQEVRLGGRVLNVINTQTETSFEVAVLPLDDNARPELHQAYQGRMIVKANKFIDPLTLKDHLITVLGTVAGTTVGKVGQADYRYLTLNLQGYQVWQVRDNIVPITPPFYGYGGYNTGPYWQAGWGPASAAYMPGWGWYPSESLYQVDQQVVE